LGESYKNDLFVGTVKSGAILKFDLSPSRKTLSLSGPLADTVADNSADGLLAEQSSVLFGSGFGIVSDLVPGPGGMYVLSLSNGTLYRITTATGATPSSLTVVPEPLTIALILPLLGATRRRRAPR
jgi:hypothetical protein